MDIEEQLYFHVYYFSLLNNYYTINGSLYLKELVGVWILKNLRYMTLCLSSPIFM